MPGDNESIYLYKKDMEQIYAPAMGELNGIQQNAFDNDWAELNKNQSSYHTAIDKHIDMQNRLLAERKKGGKADDAIMAHIKEVMVMLTVHLEDEISADFEGFGMQLRGMRDRYDELIASCNAYLETHSSILPQARRRRRMVKEVMNFAIEERAHFDSMSSNEELFKNRKDGMILGNVIGTLITMNETKIVGNDELDMSSMTKYNKRLFKETDKYDYLVNTEADELTHEQETAYAANKLALYLGIGDLTRKTDIIAAKDKKGRAHYGLRYAGRLNKSDDSLDNIKKRCAGQGEQLKVIYTADALKQITSLQLFNVLLGKSDYEPDKELLLINEQQVKDGVRTMRVTGVYMNTVESAKIFDHLLDDEKLRKENGTLPAFDRLRLDSLDKEFVNSILAIRPEDIGVLVGNLLSEKERNAFGLRLMHLKRIIVQRINEQEQGLGFLERGEINPIVEKDGWNTAERLESLQDHIESTGKKQFSRSMFSVPSRVEGFAKDDMTENEKNYENLYKKIKSQLVSSSDADKVRILSEYGYELVRNSKYVPAGYRATFKRVIERLRDEFMSEVLLAANLESQRMQLGFLKHRYVSQTYMIKGIDDVPEEMRDKEEIKKAVENRITGLKAEGMKGSEKEIEETARDQVNEDIVNQYKVYVLHSNDPGIIRELVETNVFMNGGAIFSKISNDKQSVLQESLPEIISKNRDEQRKIFDADKGRGEYDKGMSLWMKVSVRAQKYNYYLLNKEKVSELEKAQVTNVKENIQGIINNLNDDE